MMVQLEVPFKISKVLYDALIDAIIANESSDEESDEEDDETVTCQCGATNNPEASTCTVCVRILKNTTSEAQAAFGNNQYSIADSIQDKCLHRQKKSDYTVNQTLL